MRWIQTAATVVLAAAVAYLACALSAAEARVESLQREMDRLEYLPVLIRVENLRQEDRIKRWLDDQLAEREDQRDR